MRTVRVTWSCLAFVALVVPGVAFAQTSPSAEVRVVEQGGETPGYWYIVRNAGDSPIVSVIIGLDYPIGEPELTIAPLGWSIMTGIPTASASSASGWNVDLITQEESDVYQLSWESSGAQADLPPGQTLEGFSVKVAAFSEPYRSGHWTVIFADSSVAWGTLTPGDVTAAITPGGPPVTVTTTMPSQNARIIFEATAGQRVSLDITNVTIGTSSCCSARVSMTNPDGSALLWPTYFGTSGKFIDTLTLAATGTYTILLDPESTATGSVTLTLYDVPADLTGTIVPGGPAVSLTTSTPGQNGVLMFAGTAGQRISVEMTSVTLANSTVSIRKPDGTMIVARLVIGATAFIDATVLPVGGTYTLVVDPAVGHMGAMTLRMHDVAELAGSIVSGGAPLIVNVTIPGQNARLTFSGTSAQQLALQVSSVTIANSTLSVLNPDGTTLVTRTFGTSGATIDNLTLPSTGTYTISVDPSGPNIGSMTLTLVAATDVTGTIVPGGSPVTVTIGTAGQNARITFSGVAGRRISLQLTAVTIGASSCCSLRVSILNPDGSVLVSPTYAGTNGGFIDTRTLAASGTYTILLDPDGSNTGSASLTLFDVPADVSGTIQPDGSPVTVTTGTAGQNALLTFGGTSGQRISLRIASVSIAGGIVSILNPDGSTLASTFVSTSGGSIDVRTLSVSGTYSVRVDASTTNTGSVTLTLYDVPADISSGIVPGGPAVTVTIGTPGQNAQLTFAGTIGQRISLRMTSVSIASGTVSILNPDDSTVFATFVTTSGGFIDVRTLAVNGTYTVRVDPSSMNTGSVTLTLYEVPTDPDATVVIGGGAATLATTTPGQNASLSFGGTSGQQITVRITSNGMGFVAVRLLRPDGTTLTTLSSSAGSFNLPQQTLGSTGTYRITLDPNATNIGSINVAVTTP